MSRPSSDPLTCHGTPGVTSGARHRPRGRSRISASFAPKPKSCAARRRRPAAPCRRDRRRRRHRRSTAARRRARVSDELDRAARRRGGALQISLLRTSPGQLLDAPFCSASDGVRAPAPGRAASCPSLSWPTRPRHVGGQRRSAASRRSLSRIVERDLRRRRARARRRPRSSAASSGAPSCFSRTLLRAAAARRAPRSEAVGLPLPRHRPGDRRRRPTAARHRGEHRELAGRRARIAPAQHRRAASAPSRPRTRPSSVSGSGDELLDELLRAPRRRASGRRSCARRSASAP